MASRIVVTGEVATRKKGTNIVNRDIRVEDSRLNRQQLIELLWVRLIEDNELGLSSGIHIFKDVAIEITTI